MKKVFTSILLIALCLSVFGQKLVKEKMGSYKYTQLPSDITLVDFSTYTVEAAGANSDAYRRDEIMKYVNLYGFEKVTGNSDFKVFVEEYPLRWGEIQKKDKTVTTKDKDGNEKNTKYYFWQKPVNFKYRIEMTNSNDELIYSNSHESEVLVSGEERTSYKAAGESYSASVKKFKEEVIKNQVSALMSGVNGVLCYVPKSIVIKFINMKPKKFDYPEYIEASGAFAEGYKLVSQNQDNIDAARPYFETVITQMEKALAESDPENKKARINEAATAAAYYNMAQVHFMMKEYAAAVEFVHKAAGLKKNMTNDQQHNSHIIIDMKKRYEINFPE